jgi:hypothetical protein
MRSAGNDNGSSTVTSTTAHNTPVRDAVNKTIGDVKKVVTNVSDSTKKASGANTATTTPGVRGSEAAESQQPPGVPGLLAVACQRHLGLYP